MSTPTPPPDRESASSGRGGGAQPPTSPGGPPYGPPPVAPSVGTPAPFGQGDPRSAGAWTGQTPGGDGSRSPHAARPSKPQRPPRTATSILYPKPSRESVLTAAVAIGCVIVVKFAVAFVQLIGNAIDYSPTSYANGFLASPIGLFLGSLVLYPFFYYLAAFAALALFFPLLRQSPLPIVLGRAVAAGVVATIVLALVGIVTGIRIGVTTGDWIAVALYVVFIPLSAGIQLTAVLVAGAVVAWLWLGRQGPLSAKTAAGVDTSASAAAAPPSAGSEPGPASPPQSPSARGDGRATPSPASAGPPAPTRLRDPTSTAPSFASPPSAAPTSAPPTSSRPAPAPAGGPVIDLSRFAPPSAAPASPAPGAPDTPPSSDA